MNTQASAGPLSHVRVLDLCHARAGPSCVRILADFGADVIQVVRPDPAGVDASFQSLERENMHRNKRSLALDLQTKDGLDILYRIIPTADVVVENFRVDVKYRLGVDYETLSAINPRLVYGSISGFGQDGPYSSRAGVDQIAQGLGGLMSVNGFAGGGPLRVGIPIADVTSGLYLAHGIMAALIERENSGKGQWVQTSLLESMIAMLDFQAARWLIGGEVPSQAGNDHPSNFPTGVWPVSDGMINVSALGERMWRNFLKAVEAEELLSDDRFNSTRDRASHRAELREILEPKFRQRTSAEWIERFTEVGVPAGPILTVDKVFEDPQVVHLGMAETIESSRHGPLRLVRSPIRLSRTSTGLWRSAPLPGENTADVLSEFGYGDEEISRLAEGGAIGSSVKVGARETEV